MYTAGQMKLAIPAPSHRRAASARAGSGTATSRRTATGSARCALVTALGLAYVAVLAINLAILLAPPRLSLTLVVSPGGEARVGWVLPGGTLWEGGVRPGDRVLALDGRPPGIQDAGSWEGKGIVVRTRSGAGGPHHADAVRRGHDTWPLLVLSPWFFLLGILIFLRAPRPEVGGRAYSLFASAAFALALAPGAVHDHPVASALEWCMISFAPVCFLLFFLAFPVPRGSARLRVGLLAVGATVSLLSVASIAWWWLYAPLSLVRLLVLVACLVGGCGIALYSFMTSADVDARRGLTIVAVGTVASILPFLALYVGPVMMGRPAVLAAEQAILPLGLLPASFAYAILRHGVLRVPLLQRWLMHGMLWIGLIVPYAAIIAAEEWLLAPLPEPGRRLAFAAALVLLVGVSFGWLRDRLRRGLDRLIFKDSYDYRAALQGLSRDLSVAGDLDARIESLPSRLRRMMNLDFAVLLIRAQDGFRVRGASGIDRPGLLPALTEAARGVATDPSTSSFESGAVDALFVPLHLQGDVVGHICLGPKASGEPFRGEDRDLLATLSGHVAAVVRNAQLVEDLRAKVGALDALNERLQRAQEEERARIAADIHDEPLQTAIQLRRQLAASEGRGGAGQNDVPLAQALVDELRAVSTALRPPALEDLGLQAALDALASEQGERTGVPILLEVDAAAAEMVLTLADEIVLYRAVQEALNNCLRHARARRIGIALGARDGFATLRVSDDGVGFDIPGRLDALAEGGHLGLVGLRERVQRAGGRLVLSSAPGEGTVLELELPVREASQ